MADPQSNPRVVVIGGGFGGIEVARALGRAGMPVTVIDRQNYHLFQPLLYQVATAALSPADDEQRNRRSPQDFLALFHLESLMRKLAVSSRAEAVSKSMRLRLLAPYRL